MKKIKCIFFKNVSYKNIATTICYRCLSPILFFSIAMATSLYAEQILSEKELNLAKSFYSSLAPNDELKADVIDVFDSYPIYTNIKFRIAPMEDNILDKMFTDLDYTGNVGRIYARSPYLITKRGDHYRAQIRDVVDGNIYLLRQDKKNNHFIYLVKGYYDTFVTLRGKMVVDIVYDTTPTQVNFTIKAYVIVDNTYMWRLARYIKSLPSFQAKIDKLIDLNVKATIRLGIRTVMGIKRDLKGKKF